MPNRFTDSDKWRDPWFHRLDAQTKLVFLYLCDACDIAGFWEIDGDRCSYETGVPIKYIQGCLDALGEKLIVNGRFIWVRNFLKCQRNVPLNPNNNAHRGIIERLEKFRNLSDDIAVLIDGGDPYFSPCQGASEGLTSPPVMVKVRVSSHDSKDNNALISKKDEFEESFWPNVPNRLGKGRAREAFIAARKKASLEEILDGLPGYRKYEEGRAQQSDYRPLHPATWLNQERWGDEVVSHTSVGKVDSSLTVGGHEADTYEKAAAARAGL